MATWYQERNPVQLYHDTDWTVVVDPPNEMQSLYRTNTKAMADVYVQRLKEGNPRLVPYTYILPPRK